MAIAADASELRPRHPGAPWVKSKIAALLTVMVALWIFSGGFVINEPAPYELLFVAVVGIGAFSGWAFHRANLPLIMIWVLFLPFAFIAAFQGRVLTINDALLYEAVSAFLFFTAVWVANYVADAPQERMRLIVKAWIAAAVICSLGGIGGYLGVIPGADLLTRYGRAKGFFQDPNVFAPFLIPPAMFLLQRVMLASRRQRVWAAGLYMILMVGVFASFSRAAWAYFGVSSLAVVALVFFLEATVREKARIMLLTIAGALTIVVAVGGLLSIPSVQRLFEIRATSQGYDEGETGRFGRQGYAFDLALQHPAGFGALEFAGASNIREEPHDTFVTVLLQYGWGGGACIYAFFGLTLWRGFSALARPSPNRLIMIPLVVTFVCLTVEAAIIDIDHWRHFYLLGGLIWGVAAAYGKVSSKERLGALL